MNLEEKKRSLEKSAAVIAARHEGLDGLVGPFAALAAARAEARAVLARRGLPEGLASEMAWRGAPLFDVEHLPDLADAFSISAAILLPAVQEGFPELDRDAALIAAALAEERLDPATCVRAAFENDRAVLEELAAAASVAPDRLSFLLFQMLKPCMEVVAEKVGASVVQTGWYKASCPVCGRSPELGELKEIRNDNDYLVSKGGQLWMRCELCSFQWRFPRVKCPECGADHQQENDYYHCADDPSQRAYVCRQCGAYFPCLNTVDAGELLDPDLVRLAFLPLELRLREMGCKPLSAGAAIPD